MSQLVGSNSLGLGKLIDGKNQFVHIMYSANVDGSNMTSDIQADTKYIGIVTSNSETAPTNPSDYSWGRFVGTSGTSSYTWLRYSPNEDGSNMTANPTPETKYIGVAITADNNAPTDYTKYSWALIKGDDGRGISKTEVTYQKSTSGTVIPTGTWVTTIPTVNAGEYLWTRTLFTYTDNTTSSTYSVARSGVTGLGISRSDVDYQKSTSGTVAPTGAWTATIPTVAANEYLWTRTTLTYTNATTSVSYSVGKMGADGKDAQLLYLTASSQIQAFDKDDRPKTTQAITISAKLQNASGTATFVAIPYIGNIAQTAITLGGTGNDRTLLPSQWTNTQWTTIAITATLGSLTDTISVIKVKDGAIGPKGDQGNQGIPGEKGEDGRTPYTHWAYAWSSDGKDRFTTVYPEENLLALGKIFNAPYTVTKTNAYFKDIKTGIPIEPNTVYAFQWDFKHISGNDGEQITLGYAQDYGYFMQDGISVKISEKKAVFKTLATIPSDRQYLGLRLNRASTITSSVYEYTYLKVEKLGTINEEPTIYTPAPSEDFANAYPTFAGTYTDYEPTDSEDPSKYTWQRILGESGQDGISVTGTQSEYVQTTSSVEPTSGWSATRPTPKIGMWLWVRTRNTLSNGTYTNWVVTSSYTGRDSIFISATAPSNPTTGTLWQKPNDPTVLKWNGTAWENWGMSINNIVADNVIAENGMFKKVTGVEIVGSTIRNPYTRTYVDNSKAVGTIKMSDSQIVNDRTNYDKNGVVTNTYRQIIDNSYYQMSKYKGDHLGDFDYIDAQVNLDYSALIFQQFGNPFTGAEYMSTGIRLTDSRVTVGSSALEIHDLVKVPTTMLNPASGWQRYSEVIGYTNTPTATRVGRTVQIAGAFKPINQLSAGQYTINQPLPVWARPLNNITVIQQGSGLNRILIEVRKDGAILVSRYGTTADSAIPAGAWINISCVFAGQDLF